MAEALRAYQKLRRLLAQELGVDPAQETEAAYIELLGPTTARAPGGAGADADAGLPAGLAPGSNTPFVGRDAELDSLAGARPAWPPRRRSGSPTPAGWC